jgi:signal transduction histidine kinase/CheY-like chemotaxis protein
MAGAQAKMILFTYYSIPGAILVSVMLTADVVWVGLMVLLFIAAVCAFTWGIVSSQPLMCVECMLWDMNLGPFLGTSLVVGGYLSLKHDILTTFLQIEQIYSAAAKMKDEFLASVSHEFKTPLNGIVGMTTLLEGDRGSMTPSQSARIDVISQCSAILRLLVENALILGRELKAADLTLSLVRPRQLFGHVVTVIQSLGTHCEVVLEVHHNVPQELLLAESCLVQIALNLGSNAMKYSPTSPLSQVRVEVRMGTPQILEFAVIDEGVGISKEFVRTKMFQPYQREDAGVVSGTGLGLVISEKLVRNMGGTIKYKPNPKGKGSIFYVQIPVGRQGEMKTISDPDLSVEEVEEEEEHEEVLELKKKEFSVLICEDNHVNLMVLKGMLKRLHVLEENVYAVIDGGHAVEWLLQTARERPKVLEQPLLVLCDLSMPVLNGRNVRELWKAMLPMLGIECNHRFVCVTAAGEQQGTVFDDVIQKPVKMEKLKRILDHMRKEIKN